MNDLNSSRQLLIVDKYDDVVQMYDSNAQTGSCQLEPPGAAGILNGENSSVNYGAELPLYVDSAALGQPLSPGQTITYFCGTGGAGEVVTNYSPASCQGSLPIDGRAWRNARL